MLFVVCCFSCFDVVVDVVQFNLLGQITAIVFSVLQLVISLYLIISFIRLAFFFYTLQFSAKKLML